MPTPDFGLAAYGFGIGIGSFVGWDVRMWGDEDTYGPVVVVEVVLSLSLSLFPVEGTGVVAVGGGDDHSSR